MASRALVIPFPISLDALKLFIGGRAVEIVFRGITLKAEGAFASFDLLVP